MTVSGQLFIVWKNVKTKFIGTHTTQERINLPMQQQKFICTVSVIFLNFIPVD
jgi:hypothetical protein